MDQTTNALAGIGRTLRNVVAPAVSAGETLAQQELRMVMRYMEFLRVRVDHLYARARYELTFHGELAATVGALVGGEQAGVLERAAARAAVLLAVPGAPIAELRDASLEIAALVSDAVSTADGGDTGPAVERAVVQAYERLTMFERSWYQPLGMDHFGDELPPLESLLAAADGAGVARA